MSPTDAAALLVASLPILVEVTDGQSEDVLAAAIDAVADLLRAEVDR